MEILDTAKNILANSRGWRTTRKVVVIESDDWGTIRMPSSEVADILEKKGLAVTSSAYDLYDTLETRDDLERLFNLLSDFKNKPVITFNTVMANPDFDEIKKSNYSKYTNESFTQTYRRLGKGDFDLWKKAMTDRIMKPQFHAREHVNIHFWMKTLQSGDRDTRLAFDYEYFGLKTKTGAHEQKSFLASYFVSSDSHLSELVEITNDGLSLFEKVFGFKAESFVACNYTWPKQLESTLAKRGIAYIQSQRAQLAPNPENGAVKIIRHFTGEKNASGQYYLIRNCYFEPSLNQTKDWVKSCLKDIKIAFACRKPAIISSHRVNFVGGLSSANSDNGLRQLSSLIKAIIRTWPDVEFMSSDQAGNLISTK
jgi:hypothetical protein